MEEEGREEGLGKGQGGGRVVTGGRVLRVTACECWLYFAWIRESSGAVVEFMSPVLGHSGLWATRSPGKEGVRVGGERGGVRGSQRDGREDGWRGREGRERESCGVHLSS